MMNTYNRIPLSMDKGRAVLEYGGDMCRVTLQLQGIPTDRLCKPYLLWEDTYLLLPKPLNTDRGGRCNFRCEVKTDRPDKIRALAIISEDLQPVSIGYIQGEYDWQKCFMLKDEDESRPEEEKDNSREEPSEVEQQPMEEHEHMSEKTSADEGKKEVFKSIVCRLSDDLKELREYADMPQLNETEVLFKRHDPVQPFFGCEGEWIKINIRELAMVNSLWKYINNPLVAHACRHYHHLILGRCGGGLLFGVPWQYKADYRLEAGIQGFNEIKAVEDKPLAEGDMCYLLTAVE